MPYPIDEAWCLLKGRMFTPVNQQTLPTFFADDCPKGTWLSVNDVPDTKTNLLLQKQDWLAEIVGYTGELQPIRRDLTHSACFATLVKGRGKKRGMDEKARFFLLPHDFFQRE